MGNILTLMRYFLRCGRKGHTQTDTNEQDKLLTPQQISSLRFCLPSNSISLFNLDEQDDPLDLDLSTEGTPVDPIPVYPPGLYISFRDTTSTKPCVNKPLSDRSSSSSTESDQFETTTDVEVVEEVATIELDAL